TDLGIAIPKLPSNTHASWRVELRNFHLGNRPSRIDPRGYCADPRRDLLKRRAQTTRHALVLRPPPPAYGILAARWGGAHSAAHGAREGIGDASGGDDGPWKSLWGSRVLPGSEQRGHQADHRLRSLLGAGSDDGAKGRARPPAQFAPHP